MYDFLLFIHFVGLALALGAGFANFTLGIATSDMPMEERKSFMLRAMALMKNGSVGLLFLIASGLGMLFMRGVAATFQTAGGAFHGKLTLVVVMIGLFGYMQVLGKRVREAQGGPDMAKMPKVGRLMLATGVAVTLLAVLAFH
jgi:uncharacterized membrane protein